MPLLWQCGRYTLNLDTPKIMGVLNCTPDSFSDGGRYRGVENAIARAHEMVAEGADMIDVGAESTRPGSYAVDAEEEIARLTPVVSKLVRELRVPVSVDTKKAPTMRAMLELGADIINDVHALEDRGALAAVRESRCGICLMHMRGMPENMQDNTEYGDVLAEVDGYLGARLAACLEQGIDAQRIVLDPGFGFGKTPAQNMMLVKHLPYFSRHGQPLLLGVSRKSTIGHILDGAPVDKRMTGSVVLGVLGAQAGAHILRVHDVAETRQALQILAALNCAGGKH